MGIIISSQFVWFLIKNAKDKLKPAFIGLSILFSLYALMYTIRIITTIVRPPEENYLQLSTIENIYVILSQIVILIIGIFLVVIINKKLLKILTNLAKQISSSQCLLAITEIQNAKLLIETTNVDKRLALEVLLLNLPIAKSSKNTTTYSE